MEFHIYLLMKVKPNESIGLLGSLYKAGNGHVKHPKNANNWNKTLDSPNWFLSLILLVQLEMKGGVVFYRVLASKEDPISWSISEWFQNHANPYSLQLYS